MQKSSIFRLVFFIIFFSIGAVGMGLSVLCEDLVRYYSNVQFTKSAKQSIEKLKTLNEQYGSIIETMEKDPNIYKRVARAAIGAQYQDPNAIYPNTTARQLAAAKKALDDSNEAEIETAIPAWLSRCSEPRRRMELFFSGVILILISFVCFRPLKNIQ